jgi:hypothetical protein
MPAAGLAIVVENKFHIRTPFFRADTIFRVSVSALSANATG